MKRTNPFFSLQCPFHGKIIARDEMGRPSNPDEEHLQPSTSSSQLDWQDPQLLKEIEAEIGIDLTMPKKGARRKRKVRDHRICFAGLPDQLLVLRFLFYVEYIPLQGNEGLSDIKKAEDTTRRRLERKVFNK